MPEHADMNTCPACKNDLVCHDQGECLRPTPETDEQELHEPYLVNELPFCVVRIDFARTLERERNEAREAFVIATDQLVRVQGELREARNSITLLQMDLDVASCLADELAESRTEVSRLQMELDASCNAEELRQAREENARLREALQANLFHHALACVWQHQDGTFGDKTRVTEDSCKCPPKVKAFRKLLGTNSENKGFDP